MLPKHGIVLWRDAAGSNAKKLRLDRLTKNLPHREALGWLFEDSEGTIIVIHERTVQEGIQKQIEFTLIPKSWIISITPLTVQEAAPDGTKST